MSKLENTESLLWLQFRRMLNGECLLAVRSGTWKYIPALGSGGWGSGGDQSQPVQLHNLADDETKNLAVAMPDKSLK